MNINFDAIKQGIYTGCRLAGEQIGYLRDHTVKLIQFATPYFQERHWAALGVAGVGVVIANLIIVELALKITELVAGGIDRIATPYKELSSNNDPAAWKRAFGLGSFFVLLIGSANYGLYKGLKVPFSPLVMTAISMTSCFGNLFYKAKKLNH